MNDPFNRLGIPASSSAGAIRKAYRTLAKACHPDMRTDKEAAAIEFRELTRIYEIALSLAGKKHFDIPARGPPPPRPKPTGPIVCWVPIVVDNFEISLFGEIIRDIRVPRELIEYGGKIVITLRLKGKNEQTFEFDVPPNTKNGQKFRFNHPVGIIEIMVVSGH